VISFFIFVALSRNALTVISYFATGMPIRKTSIYHCITGQASTAETETNPQMWSFWTFASHRPEWPSGKFVAFLHNE